ncbi:hypothetical protein [Psychrilyobacter sp.]|uniref:hypothetical protein n=1 Tax=Psychrilyobacter sp. TaxID=2586924 RepID=UPI003019E9E0
MKMLKYLMILVISTIFIGCSNFQPAKKVISIEYSESDKTIVTTYEDGSTKVENLGYLRWQRDRDDRRDRR